MNWKGKRIALALGAGGARGLAHIGVLGVLEKERIPIDLIVGTSMGALIGGAYATGISPEELRRKAEGYLHSTEFQSSAIKAIPINLQHPMASKTVRASSILLTTLASAGFSTIASSMVLSSTIRKGISRKVGPWT